MGAQMAMGVLQSLSPSVYQLNGGNRKDEIGEIARQALRMALMAALVISLVITNARIRQLPVLFNKITVNGSTS